VVVQIETRIPVTAFVSAEQLSVPAAHGSTALAQLSPS
jgi:hypothetical protein